MIRLLGCSMGIVVAAAMMAASVRADDAEAAKAGSGKLRHVVLFKFKEGTTPGQIKAIEDAFRALPKKIPNIIGFEWGTNVSPENKAKGFTHCFLLTFPDAASRDAYLPHPAHRAFGKVVGPYLDDVLVVDFTAQD
jgi:hypothetical protein